MRPGEPFLITMDDVDLEHGMLRIGKLGETKRAFVAFLRPETLEFIKSQYLPRREEFVARVSKAMENVTGQNPTSRGGSGTGSYHTKGKDLGMRLRRLPGQCLAGNSSFMSCVSSSRPG